MPKQSKANFILLIFLIFLISFTFSQTYDCDPENRPYINDCYSQEEEWSCGYYKDDCPRKICGKNFVNGCEACGTPDILYYKTGACEDGEIVLNCSEDSCYNSDSQPEILLIYDPICGQKRGTGDQLIFETIYNGCVLCAEKKYLHYQLGVCQIDRRYCDHDSKDNQDYSKEPVCAYLETEEFGPVYITASNASEACEEKAVEFYTKGPCGALSKNTTYCFPNYRPQECSYDYDPVCGFSKDENGDMQHKVYVNPCAACADSSVLYHWPGACVFTCEGIGECCMEFYGCSGQHTPICGIYEENGEAKQVSLRNPCLGCLFSSRKISNFTEGFCLGHKEIRCEDESETFLEGVLRPVCGYSAENCNDNSCRRTYAEAYLACKDADTIWYSFDACPGDGGVSCEKYRARPGEPENPDEAQELYTKVCGYTQKDCIDESCRQNYKDQYDACINRSVIYFTDGSC